MLKYVDICLLNCLLVFLFVLNIYCINIDYVCVISYYIEFEQFLLIFIGGGDDFY